jgi:Magnesium chelatase, subunit ChlI
VVTSRPCLARHHSISDVGLIGGGHVPLPGEVSLAHHGVRCLDELLEFERHGLDLVALAALVARLKSIFGSSKLCRSAGRGVIRASRFSILFSLVPSRPFTGCT